MSARPVRRIGATGALALGLWAGFAPARVASAQTPAAPGKPADDAARDADIFGSPAPPPTPASPADPAPGAPVPAASSSPPPGSSLAPSSPAPSASPPATPPASAPAAGDAARDEAVLGDATAKTRLSDEVAPEDPLKIGGQLYLRLTSSGLEEQSPDAWSIGAPALADAYFDARPNDRVRGFVLGRMTFDPTLPETAGTSARDIGRPEASGASNGSAPLASLFGGRTRGPHLALDQMWLRFDVARRVFLTAGKQHVRWGTARFWTPTDYLHVRRRNPLDVFDARTGTTMLKVHVPWEARGWNLYAFAVPESEERTTTVSGVAGAMRAEVVLGSTEVGAGVFARKGQKPKLGFDLSTGIWDFDLYGEVALRHAGDVDRLIYDDMAFLPDRTMAPEWKDRGVHEREQLGRYVDAVWPARPGKGWKAQAVGGFTYQRRYHDNDVWTLGAEYFYNPFGYGSPQVYPGLIFPRATPLRDPATFFYLGRHYASLFLLLPRPYDWDLTTFTLSTLANVSDGSYITRLDYSLTVLTHLDFQAYAAVRYGSTEGEFRLGVRNLDLGGGLVVSQAPALLDLGVALRMAF